MLELLETLGVSFFEVVVAGFVGYVFWKMKKEDDKKDEVQEIQETSQKKEIQKQEYQEELILGLARISLINKMQESLDRGFTTQADYEVTKALYEPYTKLGGNGVVQHLFEDRYNNLKVKEHE